MIKLLVTDGIHPDGKIFLEYAGFQVDSEKVDQHTLAGKLKDYDAVIVRSATKIRKDIIDQCPKLKVIARGGVGLDNIDADYAQSKGIHVINTPAASSLSVAELTFGHIFALSRSIHETNRKMPDKGRTHFKELKSAFSKGFELKGKTLGVWGFGRIGQEVARIGLGLGMKVLPVDLYVDHALIHIDIVDITNVSLTIRVNTVGLDEMLPYADIITCHVPAVDQALISANEIAQMKDGVFVINTSRGGVIEENALLHALETGKIAGAGLDVFENEPNPLASLLDHPRISVTPHIGASTKEAQANIGKELAEKIIAIFSQQ